MRSAGLMRVVVLVLCVAGCGSEAPSVSSHLGGVVGGRPATAQELKSTVALLINQRPLGPQNAFCTGTLIAPRVVLTAGHCVSMAEGNGPLQRIPAQAIVVGAGFRDSATFAEADLVSVSQIALHPGFDFFRNAVPDRQGLARVNDIALLLLSRAVTKIPSAPILAVQQVPSDLSADTQVIVSGFGQIEDGSTGRLFLADTLVERTTSTEILTHSNPNIGQGDACFGDSGGPLYVEVDGVTHVVGATSRARFDVREPCGAGGIFTLASAYVQWITDNSNGLFQGGGDAGVPDAGPDGAAIGEPCERGSDCASGVCFTEQQSFPGGYCGDVNCTSDFDCGGDAICAQVDEDGNTLCFDTCGDPTDCRPGYGCLNAAPGVSVCLPVCQTDGECHDDEVCESNACVPRNPGDLDAGVNNPQQDSGVVIPDAAVGLPDGGSNLLPNAHGKCSVQGVPGHRGTMPWGLLLPLAFVIVIRRRRL